MSDFNFAEINPDHVGGEGNGYLWPAEDENDDEDDEIKPKATLRGKNSQSFD